MSEVSINFYCAIQNEDNIYFISKHSVWAAKEKCLTSPSGLNSFCFFLKFYYGKIFLYQVLKTWQIATTPFYIVADTNIHI